MKLLSLSPSCLPQNPNRSVLMSRFIMSAELLKLVSRKSMAIINIADVCTDITAVKRVAVDGAM